MLEPLAVDPSRSVAPAANSMASARLVFPAPAGPTSAITRVPLDGCPAMRLSLRAVTGAASRTRKALGRRLVKQPPSACFALLARGNGWTCAGLGPRGARAYGKHGNESG